MKTKKINEVSVAERGTAPDTIVVDSVSPAAVSPVAGLSKLEQLVEYLKVLYR